MNENTQNPWAEIIGKAAVSHLGISALIILVLGSVIIALVKPTDSSRFRFAAITMLFLFCSSLLTAAFYTATPTTLPSPDTTNVQSEKPSTQPPEPTRPRAPVVTSMESISFELGDIVTVEKIDCGTAWTGWIEANDDAENPCPGSCTQGNELGLSYRAVGLLPQLQIKYKFQCWKK